MDDTSNFPLGDIRVRVNGQGPAVPATQVVTAANELLGNTVEPTKLDDRTAKAAIAELRSLG